MVMRTASAADCIPSRKHSRGAAPHHRETAKAMLNVLKMPAHFRANTPSVCHTHERRHGSQVRRAHAKAVLGFAASHGRSSGSPRPLNGPRVLRAP